MLRKTLTLGVAPIKRASRDMQFAKQQKDAIMAIIRQIRPDVVRIVDIDELSENGIAFAMPSVPAIVKKFRDAQIDALFIPFCDFGEESVLAEIASAFRLPTLIWGSRDEFPNTLEARGPDTQCGMFAATKVLLHRNVKYSYIYNVRKDSPAFRQGYENFIRYANVIKDLNGLTIGKVGNRPQTFQSVVNNEASLMTKLNIGITPIAPASLMRAADELRESRDSRFLAHLETLRSRFDTFAMDAPMLEKTAAMKVAVSVALQAANVSACAFECWSAFYQPYGFTPCMLLGDMMDEGIPLACECDVNGAISQVMLYAASLYDESVFLADLTIRNPQNDNSELLWHCGPFPYSLKAEDSPAKLVLGQEQFRLRDGALTLCRFDEGPDGYSLFAGQGMSNAKGGPVTSGTYTYLDVDNWKRWEEKLIFGPYIHHIAGAYGQYQPVLREVARYLGIHFDDAGEQGVHSL